MRQYHIWTIGCQMNKADAERVGGALERHGFGPCDEPSTADVVVLNSCCVRQSAEERVYGKLGSLVKLKRQNPDLIVGLMGCMVGPDGDQAELQRRFPMVDVFFNALAPEGLLEAVIGRFGVPATDELAVACGGSRNHEGSADVCKYVPVIYGCNKFCTYCIVPYRRGRERSRPLEEIACAVEELAARGVREVTLLGQNVDSYGRDLSGHPDLADLLYRLDGVNGLYRIRFLTSHPRDMSVKLIDAVAVLPKVCEHINLPVQAGDDEVLRAMRRGYAADEYRALVLAIRQRVPDASLSTDVIVGFPGETDEQFQATRRLVEDVRFDVVHVAAYSPRPGTVAARLPDDVPLEVKQERLRVIETLQESIATETNRSLLGSIVEVLVEGRHKGRWQGRTRSNKLVFFDDEREWQGRLVHVKILRTSPWSLQGSLVESQVAA